MYYVFMGHFFSTETVNPARLSIAAKAHFIERLYQIHSQIFSGVGRAAFVRYVVDPPARMTKIRIYKDQAHNSVGYCAVHFLHVTVASRPCVVMRAEAGLLPAYRGSNATLLFGFSEAIKYRLYHPTGAMYYLGTFVHPGVFHMCQKFFKTVYPNVHCDMPFEIRSTILNLLSDFGVAAVPGENELVCDVGWVVNESPEEAATWRADRNPGVQLYLSMNPHYALGRGLAILVPLTIGNIVFSLVAYLSRRSEHHRPRPAS